VACMAGFLLFGAPNHIRCMQTYGHPLGPDYYREGNGRASKGLDIQLLKANAARYLYQATEPSALPFFLMLTENKKEIVGNIEAWRAETGERLFEALAIDSNDPTATKLYTEFSFATPFPFHEDIVWFGPLGLLLWTPVVLYWGVACFFRRDPVRLLLFLSCAGFVFFACAEMVWSPWRGRYFVLAVSLGAPLLSNLFKRGKLFALARWVLVLLAVSVLVKTLVRNESKALVGPNAIWGKERDALRYANLPHDGKALRAVERLLPQHATVALLVQAGDWDYPLFGQGLTRTILPVASWPESLSTEWLDSHERVTHFVVHRAGNGLVPWRAPSGYDAIEADQTSGWSVIIRRQQPVREAPAPDSGLDSPEGGT
jgi:hypothetical protein